jgi:hypothetical protein
MTGLLAKNETDVKALLETLFKQRAGIDNRLQCEQALALAKSRGWLSEEEIREVEAKFKEADDLRDEVEAPSIAPEATPPLTKQKPLIRRQIDKGPPTTREALSVSGDLDLAEGAVKQPDLREALAKAKVDRERIKRAARAVADEEEETPSEEVPEAKIWELPKLTTPPGCRSDQFQKGLAQSDFCRWSIVVRLNYRRNKCEPRSKCYLLKNRS